MISKVIFKLVHTHLLNKKKQKNKNRTRRYYKPCSPTAPDFDKKIPKRRTTFNSREASISIDDVLAFRNAIEIPDQNEYENIHSMQDGITVLQEYGK